MGWWYWLDVKEILLDHETLNALGLAQTSDNRRCELHWIHLNSLEIKRFGHLEPPLFLHNAITPVQMATAFTQNSPSNHRAFMISQTNQMQSIPSPRAYRRMFSKMAHKVARAAHSVLHLLQSAP